MKAGLSIEELAAEIMRQNEIKEDYVVNSPCLQMDAWDSDLFLRVMDGQQTDRLEPLEISENAHRQISARLGIPIKYYNRMLAESPDLLTQNVNTWFNKNPEQRRPFTDKSKGRDVFFVVQNRTVKTFERINRLLKYFYNRDAPHILDSFAVHCFSCILHLFDVFWSGSSHNSALYDKPQSQGN